MTPYERGQWLLLLHAYLAGQRAQAPDAFADQQALFLINSFLQMAYWEDGGLHSADEIADADFHRWLLTLWPSPPAA